MIPTPVPLRAAAQAAPLRWLPDRRGSALVATMVCTLMLIMVVPETFSDPDAAFGSSLGIYRALRALLLLLGLALVVWRAKLAWLFLRELNPALPAFVLLAGASALWSIEPEVTAQRMIGVIAMSLVAMGFALVSWHRRRYQDLMLRILTALMLASVIAALAVPELGVESGTTSTLAGAWRGVTFQKNALGHLAGFGLVFWCHAALARERRWLPVLIGLGLALTALVGSRSSTSLLSAVMGCLLLALLLRAPPNLRRWMPVISGVFAVIVLGYALAVLKVVPGLDALLAPITALTGKDQTFSNRSVIWEIINEHIRLAPLLGSGYGAYWIGPVATSPSFVFLSRMYFYPTQAHNGYLETINDLGFVGLAVLLFFLIVYMRQSLQLFRIDRSQGALFIALFFVQAIENLSEANWFQSNSFEWVIMLLSTAALGRALLEHRLHALFGVPQVRSAVPPSTGLRLPASAGPRAA